MLEVVGYLVGHVTGSDEAQEVDSITDRRLAVSSGASGVYATALTGIAGATALSGQIPTEVGFLLIQVTDTPSLAVASLGAGVIGSVGTYGGYIGKRVIDDLQDAL